MDAKADLNAMAMEALERQLPFNERLIDEVRKFPSLYNQNRRTVTDSRERNRIWDGIAAAIDPAFTGEFAKRRWLQIRDRYRKELKVVLRHGYPIGAKWKHFTRLSWLDPHLKDIDAPGRSDDDRSFLEKIRLSKQPNASLLLNSSLDDSGMGQGMSSPEERLDSSALIFGNVKMEDDDSAQPQFPSPLSNSVTGGGGGTAEVDATGEIRESAPQRDERDDSLVPDSSPLPFPFLHPLLAPSNHGQSNDWANDEELLFGRIVGLRLKKLPGKRAKKMRASIMALLDESDSDEDEESRPAKKKQRKEGEEIEE